MPDTKKFKVRALKDFTDLSNNNYWFRKDKIYLATEYMYNSNHYNIYGLDYPGYTDKNKPGTFEKYYFELVKDEELYVITINGNKEILNLEDLSTLEKTITFLNNNGILVEKFTKVY